MESQRDLGKEDTLKKRESDYPMRIDYLKKGNKSPGSEERYRIKTPLRGSNGPKK